MTYALISISTIVLFLWTTIRYEQNQLEKEEEFKIIYPWRNVDHPLWSAKITLFDAFIKEAIVTSMLIHIIAGCAALSGVYIANTLHLMLIYNINNTTKTVLASVTAHADQLLITLLLMLFFVFMFAIWVMGDFRAMDFTDENINCDNLYVCFIYS